MNGFLSFDEIGRINLGIDGWDTYMLLQTEEPVATPTLRDLLNYKYRTDSRYPGDIFCDGVNVLAKPYSDTEYIVIIRNRYDV